MERILGPGFDVANDDTGGLMEPLGLPGLSSFFQPPKPMQLEGRCEQTLFAGEDWAGNRCDLSSGYWVPAHTVVHFNDHDECMQFCLPTQNSGMLKWFLRANIGLCCRTAPGYNDFQGSLNQQIPGLTRVRTWRYLPGESGF
mmetsp:Transcript_22645/g.76077  ORF Transcript_22645/g.76077 Transcript_22645/m.76077 type:complete len:142 (-) Transcript_22645:57-482(-)